MVLKCFQCKKSKPRTEFSKRQLSKGTTRKCNGCTGYTPSKSPAESTPKPDISKDWAYMFYDDDWKYKICNRLSVNTDYEPHLAVINTVDNGNKIRMEVEAYRVIELDRSKLDTRPEIYKLFMATIGKQLKHKQETLQQQIDQIKKPDSPIKPKSLANLFTDTQISDTDTTADQGIQNMVKKLINEIYYQSKIFFLKRYQIDQQF